jgi:hypothetical protein
VLSTAGAFRAMVGLRAVAIPSRVDRERGACPSLGGGSARTSSKIECISVGNLPLPFDDFIEWGEGPALAG